jgi:Spy/CpxP family protein refolding chaperone
MNCALKTWIVFSLAVLVAAPLMADEQAPPKKPIQAKVVQAPSVIGAKLAEQLEKANLTNEQKEKLEDIKTKFADKLAQARKAVNATLPADVRKARNAAMAKAREEGKKGDELKAAVAAAVELTEEQKKSIATAEENLKKVQTELRNAILALLTPEQRTAAGLNVKQKIKKNAP